MGTLHGTKFLGNKLDCKPYLTKGRLLLTDLPVNIRPQKLRSAFEQFGKVKKVVIQKDFQGRTTVGQARHVRGNARGGVRAWPFLLRLWIFWWVMTVVWRWPWRWHWRLCCLSRWLTDANTACVPVLVPSRPPVRP